MKFEYNNTTILWEKILDESLLFEALFKILPTKGRIAWEYNPFRNLRLDLDMFEYKGKLYTLKEFTTKTGYDPSTKKLPNGAYLYQKGELVDFITDLLSFDIHHPVSIQPAYSYDGSVDLILNDGKNLPRLINSRFSTTGMNTYEIINRKGDNDVNIYDMGDLFDIDTSLYKKTNKIPKIIFNGTQPGGALKIGNYHFYFKYADADGNETDFVAESGLVSIFKGTSTPVAMSTGQRDENSLKGVSFTIKNIDSGYLYLHVYYTRSTAEINLNFITEAVKIELNFSVNTNGISNILILGLEESTKIPISDINLQFNVIQSAKSQALCLNMLFMANVLKAEIPYEELQDLSLRFLPYLHTKKYPLAMNETYNISSTSKGYYDPKFIYDFTGYWDKDLYRLGIVYIMKDNTLSPVFNIRGREKVKSFAEYDHDWDEEVYSSAYTKFDLYKDQNEKDRQYINYDEISHMIIKSGGDVISSGNALFENSKGVVSLDSSQDTDTILGFDIRTDEKTIKELRKHVKGFFFVRQKRMPLTLCLGITIGIENNSRLPAIPTVHGVTNIKYDNTYAETADMNPEEIHFVMEGFLGRYTYKLAKKSSGFWGKLGMALAVTAIIAGSVALAVFTGGAAGAAGAFVIGDMLSAGITALGSISTALWIGATVVVGATTLYAGALQAILWGLLARHSSKAARPYKGRNAKIPSGFERKEVEDSRKLDAEFKDRVILLDPKDCRTEAMIVPDYTVDPAKFNQLFTGEEFVVEYTNSLPITSYTNCGYFLNNNGRHFYIPGYRDFDLKNKKNYVSLISVPDGISAMGIDLVIFRSKAGDPDLANKYQQTRITYKDATLNDHSDLIRGNFGPYVAMLGFQGNAATTLNIKIPGYDEGNLLNYISMRMSDHSEYLAISDRFDIAELKNPKSVLQLETQSPYVFKEVFYRGDCYICQFTQRINRNLNDSSAPYNESFVDPKTWKLFDIDDVEKLSKINVGDVNAAELGMWVTFRVRSNYNLNVRTIDDSWIAEKLESGHARGYYPYYPMSTDGSFKIPEAQVYNLGFSKSLSDRYNFEVPDVPYIKNWFGTRIMYSDINITDGYKNGFRTFRGTAYRDYTREYGSITKIVELGGNLIVVFEHGIGFLEVNEKAVAALSQSGNVYITTNNVLPEKLTILSDAIGSQWADSVLKAPIKLGSTSSVVFGVDTVAKKIWMCDGRDVTCISDFKVQEFLNNNITLGERDLMPVLGVRNVKTLYNAYKQDIMFTFYDCLEGFEDKAWNLCYNLTLLKFTTFYSWVPSFMENIDNIPFSFDRDVSKCIGKLGVSKMQNDFSDGIVLSNNIIGNNFSDRIIGELGLSNRVLPFSDMSDDANVQWKIEYKVMRDDLRNDEIFTTEYDTEKKKWYLCFIPQEGFEVSYNDKNNDGKISTDPDDGEINKYGEDIENSPNVEGDVQILGLEDEWTSKLHAELYYRNIRDHHYSDWLENSNIPEYLSNSNLVWDHINWDEDQEHYKIRMLPKLKQSISLQYPVFKDRSGRKLMLPEEDRINQDLLVRLINIRAYIKVSFKEDSSDVPINLKLFDVYKATLGDNSAAETDAETGAETGETIKWINCGYYESTVAVTTEWNLLFLTSDFWKHGLAGIIDIADDIKPTIWYGKQHPFEFECIVVNDPGTHKIFLNLELIANKAEPESFHFEVIGETYDFAKDKPNMFFRQEARKALFLYNGCNISYNPEFLKIQPRQLPRSAELVHTYYERQDKRNEIKDDYVGNANNNFKYNYLNSYNYTYKYWTLLTPDHDYRHLSGAEIVYYKNRNEYRIWQHLPAINIDKLPQDAASSVIRGNCQYLEDRWRISINPLLICYKNEYRRILPGNLCLPENSTWPSALSSAATKLPPITIGNTCLPNAVQATAFENGNSLLIPDETQGIGKDNALYGLYNWDGNSPIDTSNWLTENYIYGTNFGGPQNRKETDIRDKFMKVRIRYSGKELAVIDWLNTIYTISYA